MGRTVTRKEAEKWLGKQIAAYKKDGTVVTGKLVKISGNRLILRQAPGKKVKTKAIIPLVLFDLLAIGTAPYAFGGYPYGGVPYDGGVPYGGVPYGGYPSPYFW